MLALFSRVKEIFDNGELYLGIAAGSDRALPISHKMHIPNDHASISQEEIYEFALSHVPGEILKHPVWGPFAASALAVIIRSKWYDVPGSDVCIADKKGSGSLSMVSPDYDVSIVVTMIVATKVNLFAMNHHVGQGEITGYAKKAFNVFFPNADSDIVSDISVIHMVGHWASSIRIFSFLGIKGVKVPKGDSLKIVCEIPDDIQLRINSYPAGTAKVGVAIAILKRAVNHRLFPALYHEGSIQELVHTAVVIREHPMRYHVGARYFADKTVKIELSAEVEALICKLFIFVKTLYPRSTLAKSKIIPDPISNHDNYDEKFAEVCTAYFSYQAEVSEQVSKQLYLDDPLALSDEVVSAARAFDPKVLEGV